MKDRRNIFNRPITLLGCMISVKNQTPLSRGGPKGDSRKSRDIQSPSQRRCNLNCADSRAETKRKLFDCEPVHTADRTVQCEKPLVHSGRKCKVQYAKLSSAVSEILWTKKDFTAGKDSSVSYWLKLWNPRRLRVPSVNKTAQAVVLPSIKGILQPLREMHTKVMGFNRRCKLKWKSPPNEF